MQEALATDSRSTAIGANDVRVGLKDVRQEGDRVARSFAYGTQNVDPESGQYEPIKPLPHVGRVRDECEYVYM